MSLECFRPRVVSSNRWGQASRALTLNYNETFTCIAIAPDSEAAAVELRPHGRTDYSDVIRVTKDCPYFGPVEGKGLGVFPIVECPDDAGAPARYSHFLKLYLYKQAPPYISRKRADARYWFAAGDASNLNSGTIIYPYIPAFGRKKAYFGIGLYEAAGMDVSVIWEGGRVTDYLINDSDRLERRWPDMPANADADIWPNQVSATVDWVTLNTEANIVATEDYAYEYEGNFDYYQVTVLHNAGTWANTHMSVVLED